MSLQKKIVIAILIAGFIILATGLSITYYQVRNVLTEEVGRNFASIAKKTADRIDAMVREEISTFQYLAANQAFIKGVKENRGEAIDIYLTYYLSYVEERKEHFSLFVVNDKGKILAAGNLMPDYSSDQSGELWWKMISGNSRGKVYISDIYLDKLTGSRAFEIGIPVWDPVSNRVVGGIRSMINVETFFSFVREIDFGRTGHGMLVNSEGTPLICTLLPLAEHTMNRPLIHLLTSSGNGWAIAEDDAHGGRNSVVGFSPVEYINSLGLKNIDSHKWYIFVRQDPRETFAPISRLIIKVFLFDSAIVLIISLIGFFIAHRILIQPVVLLREGVDRVRKGDLHYRVDIRTGDEIESLADGFNRMGDALKESYYTLEEKIKERTIELEKTKNYLESILRYSTDMIITTDLSGRIVTFNEGAEQMLGYKKKEIIGTLMADYYYHSEDRLKLLDIIKSGVLVTNYETQLVRKDGKIIDISLSLSLLRNEKGKVIGTVGISKNITEWRQAQQQLREYSQKLESMVEKRTLELEESKSHLEAMLSGIADGVIFINQENMVTFINDAAGTIFNIKREEWLGRDFKETHSAEAHEKALWLIKEMREGKIKSYSSEIRSGDKTIFAHFSPIMHGPEYLGVIFISRDISGMKRLQNELQTSEARYKDLVENSPLMIHSVNSERYFLDVNKTELNILEYTLEEMREKRIEDIVPAEFKEEGKSHIERVIREGRSRVEIQFVSKGGRKIDVEISATGLYDPITTGFVRTRAFVRDITEIKRLQAELVQSEKLALVGKMSSSIAHELRNPLVPIGGFARLLHKRLNQDATLKKYADVIIKEIDRMEMLLHDILYFTKETKPRLEPVNLNEIINDLLFFYNDTFTENNIELSVDLSPDIPLFPLDCSKIRQAFMNLFSNAVDAMPGGGRLTVTSSEKVKDEMHYAVVTISDSGIGIPEDVKKSIFEPFFTTKVHGLGLGLTLTKNVIEIHGGEIRVESKEGKGTTFIISLPLS